MRFSVRSKLIVSLSALFALGLIGIGLSYRALIDVREEVDKLARQRRPLTMATHELEISVNGVGTAVLAQIDGAHPVHREWIATEQQQMQRHMLAYLSVAESDRERALGAALHRLIEEYLAQAAALLEGNDALLAVLSDIAHCSREFEQRLDVWVKRADPIAPTRRGDTGASMRAALRIEGELAQVGTALLWRSPEPTATRHQRVRSRLAELKSAVSILSRLPLGAAERKALQGIKGDERELLRYVHQMIALEDELDALRSRFIDQRARIDRLLDEEVQVLAERGFDLPLHAVDRVTKTAVRQMGFFAFPMLAICTLAVGLMMYRGVTQPLLALRKGLGAVATGRVAQPIVGMPNDEFGDLAAEFNRMTQQLRERSEELRGKDAELQRRETMAAMGSLVSGVAHEVRNPLFGITSTLDALQARLHDMPEQSRHIAVLRGEAARLQKLMQDLLDYGKPAPHVLAPASLYPVIERAVAICTHRAEESGVRIVCDLAVPGPVIAIDAQRIEQVFVNLIENALQHSPTDSAVSVFARYDDSSSPGSIVCTVSDSGPGIRTEDLPRIFEPFFSRRRGGTGLGLSIVQRIVDEHGGSVTAANRAGGGAELSLRLPLLRARPESTPGVAGSSAQEKA